MNRRPSRNIFLSVPLAAALALSLSTAHLLATGDFYEEPLQTLPDYLKLDQLPSKSFQDILDETRKAPGAAAKIDYKAELLALPKKPGAEALASIERMLVAARAGRASSPANDYAVALLNLLNDVRDLFTGPAQAAESEAYLRWRIEHANSFGLVWDKPAGNREDSPEPTDAESAKLNGELEQKLAKASPALKPHWTYLQGAALFIRHDATSAQTFFQEVAKEYPKHPRAEAALFMAARCQISRARSQEYTQQDMKLNAAERPKAKKMLEEFLAKYPRGRFSGDAVGWLGAFAYDGHDFATALRLYIQQTELADHPELYGPACEMVEKTLSHIVSTPKDKAFAEVAKYPKAAQALVYLVVNTSESDNFDGKIDSIEQVRGWRKNVLPRLGAAIAAEAKLYQAAEWKPRYLAMLAYAASGAGQQDQAIKLLATAGDAAQESDDLLLARGVVFHRAKKPAEAVTALQTLLEKFPESPLASGARLRLGLALTDNHRAGEAVLVLNKLVEKADAAKKKRDAAEKAAAKLDAAANDKKADPNAPTPPPPPAADAAEPDEAMDDDYGRQSGILYHLELDQVRALMDTLLNFAPIEELAAAALKPGLDPVLRLMITEPAAQRLLAKEQFEETRRFMTPAQWELTVGPIAKLTQAAAEAKEPPARASACLKLGDAWAAARGKILTFPLDTDERRHHVYIDYSSDANTRRVDSAPFIGAEGNYKLDLENRDELKHAFKWWLDASDAQPGSALTAQALWRALHAMPQIADVSQFTYERAFGRKWSDTAKKLYDRLKTECPDSPEAKRYAVAWDFPAPPPKKPDEEFPVSRPVADQYIPGSTALKIESGGNAQGNDSDALVKKLNDLEQSADSSSVESLAARAKALQGEVRKSFDDAYDARWVNLIDDLALFFTEPDPGPQVRKRYVKLRFSFVNKTAIGGGSFSDDNPSEDPDKQLAEEIKSALADPKTKPVADYFEFLNLAVIANHFTWVKLNSKDPGSAKGDADTYRTRDYPLMEKAARAFQAKYPKSRKREAATLLEARATYRASEEVATNNLVTWPQASRWEGGYETIYARQEPFDEKRVIGVLDAYDHAFPGGRYAADIRAYRAAVAQRMHEWSKAFALLTAQLDDQADPALNDETADRLANIFNQLTDERYRADILEAIKSSPKTSKYFAEYLDYQSDPGDALHALRFMKRWLREQLPAMAKK